MKNLFGVNVSDSENSSGFDGEIFITDTLPQYIEKKLDDSFEQREQFEKKASLPVLLSVIKTISFFCAVCITIGILKSDVSFSEGYRNAPALFWAAPICWIIFFTLKIFGYFRVKKTAESEDFVSHMESTVNAFHEAGEYLKIPENSPEIDVLMFQYTEKDGKIKHKNSSVCSHFNQSVSVYVKNDSLCMSDVRIVMKIPLSSLKNARIQKKKASFPNWNKELPFNSPEYKKYKITSNNQDIYYSQYYSVSIQDIKGEFEFFVPAYDIDTLKNLTGIEIESEK
ncbi:MAG: hypothetical protein K2I00_02665 [Ruminococcus sp.]|nr:hypothetical protein [Ruminococcus sp.]